MIRIDFKPNLSAGHRNAWNSIRSVLKQQLGTSLHIYRSASPEKKAELRKHNPTLDQVLDMIGE